MPVHTPKSVYRAWEVDGVPDSGAHQPKKAEIIQLLEQIKTAGSAPAVVRETLADLELVTPAEETYGGQVLNDPVLANNGYYFRQDGDWVKGRGFPDTAAELVELEGTANDVTAGVEAGVNPADIKVWFIEPLLTNSDDVVLNGLPVRNVNGDELAPGEWPAGRLIMLVNRTTEWRLLSDPDADAAAASAAASAAAASGYAGDADTARVAAEAAAATAVAVVGFDVPLHIRRESIVAIRSAKALGSAQYIPDGWADGFVGNDGIDEGESSGFTLNTDEGAIQVGVDVVINQVVPHATGSVIGDMTGQGGVAAAFNGVTAAAYTASARSATVGANPARGYVGKDWGSGNSKTLIGVRVWSPSTTTGFEAAGNNVVMRIKGSNSVPTAWDGTGYGGTQLYAESGIAAAAGSNTVYALYNEFIAPGGPFRYHWVEISYVGASEVYIAEVEFTETIVTLPPDGVIQSVVKVADFEPSEITVTHEIEPIDAITLGADLTVKASRDGGTTFTTGTPLQVHSLGTRRMVETVIDVSAQPAGDEVCTVITFLNDKAAKLTGTTEVWTA